MFTTSPKQQFETPLPMDKPMTAAHIAFADALAQPDGQPAAALEALHHLADELVGARMFTILVFDFPRRVAHRVYSNEQRIYPVGVDDPLGDGVWERTLTQDKKPLVLNSPEAMATLLPNTDELVGLGYGAMLNLPVIVAGTPLAAINILHDAGRYTAERVETAKVLVPAAAAILLWTQLKD
jgi:GAF domain-containing protein